MPFTGLYIKFIEKCLPGKGEIISRKPAYLDEKMLVTPSIAMGLAVKEIVRMGNMARHNVEVGMQALEDKDENKIKYVLEHEPVIDALEEDITRYLTKMSEKEMGAELSAMHTRLLHACTDLQSRRKLTLPLLNDEEIHRLNREYRDVDRPTDVLALRLTKAAKMSRNC